VIARRLAARNTDVVGGAHHLVSDEVELRDHPSDIDDAASVESGAVSRRDDAVVVGVDDSCGAVAQM
jgi:hypothetical protein